MLFLDYKVNSQSDKIYSSSMQFKCLLFKIVSSCRVLWPSFGFCLYNEILVLPLQLHTPAHFKQQQIFCGQGLIAPL